MSGIQVRIGADTSNLEQGLTRSQRMLRSNAQQMQRNIGVAARYAAAITAAGAALSVHLIRNTMKSVDEQAKLARALDTTIDGLTAMQLAGDRSGVSVEALNSSMERYTARLGQARRGMGQAADAFERLGLDANELATMGLDEQMETLGQRFRDLNLDASQSADILRDLGIRNADMARFIREGTQDLSRARDMVQQYGLALSEVDAARIEAANDAMQEIGLASQGVRQAIAVELAGTIEAVSQELSSMFGEMGQDMREGVHNAVQVSLNAFANLLDGAASVADFVEQNQTMAQFGLLGYVLLGPKGAAIGGVVGTVLDKVVQTAERFGVGLTDSQQALDEIARLNERAGATLREINRLEADKAQLARDDVSMRELMADIIADEQRRLDSILDRRQEIRDTLEENVDLEEELNNWLERNTDEGSRLADAMRAVGDAIRTSLDRDDDREPMVDALMPTTDELERRHLELMPIQEAAQNDSLNSYLRFLDSRAQAAEEHNERMAEIERQQRATMLREASIGFGRLANLMETNHRGMFEIGKAAAISQTVIDTYAAAQASYKALAGIPVVGPGLGAAAAAAAVAGGLARVSAISSRSFSSAGAGGADPGAAVGGQPDTIQGAAQQQPTQIANFELVGDVFGRDQVIGLIDQINEVVGDGVVLRTA